MAVRADYLLPQPDDAHWRAEKARKEAAIRREVKRIEAVVHHVGHDELERRAKEAGRLYAQRLFLHDHKEAIRALKGGRGNTNQGGGNAGS